MNEQQFFQFLTKEASATKAVLPTILGLGSATFGGSLGASEGEDAAVQNYKQNVKGGGTGANSLKAKREGRWTGAAVGFGTAAASAAGLKSKPVQKALKRFGASSSQAQSLASGGAALTGAISGGAAGKYKGKQVGKEEMSRNKFAEIAALVREKHAMTKEAGMFVPVSSLGNSSEEIIAALEGKTPKEEEVKTASFSPRIKLAGSATGKSFLEGAKTILKNEGFQNVAAMAGLGVAAGLGMNMSDRHKTVPTPPPEDAGFYQNFKHGTEYAAHRVSMGAQRNPAAAPLVMAGLGASLGYKGRVVPSVKRLVKYVRT